MHEDPEIVAEREIIGNEIACRLDRIAVADPRGQQHHIAAIADRARAWAQYCRARAGNLDAAKRAAARSLPAAAAPSAAPPAAPAPDPNPDPANPNPDPAAQQEPQKESPAPCTSNSKASN